MRGCSGAGKKETGFTLIEIMVVVIVLVIIAMIAVPAYLDILQRSRRADATSSLIQISLEQEKYRSNNSSYADSLSELGYSANSVDTQGGYYTLTITSANATSYTASAAPKAGTSQATDDCGTFTITQNWPNNLSASEQACWN